MTASRELIPYSASATTLDSSSTSSAVTFEIGDIDVVVPQLTGSSWPATCVVTAQLSNDGSTWDGFPDEAIEYSEFGVYQSLVVMGWQWIRFIVTTAAGSVTITPVVRGY